MQIECTADCSFAAPRLSAGCIVALHIATVGRLAIRPPFTWLPGWTRRMGGCFWGPGTYQVAFNESSGMLDGHSCCRHDCMEMIGRLFKQGQQQRLEIQDCPLPYTLGWLFVDVIRYILGSKIWVRFWQGIKEHPKTKLLWLSASQSCPASVTDQYAVGRCFTGLKDDHRRTSASPRDM